MSNETNISSQKEEYIQLWMALVHTKQTISMVRAVELKPFHISGGQVGILSILKDLEYQPTPAEISRIIARKPSTITVILNRMESKGLVKKYPDPDRKNLIRVAITGKGKMLYSEIVNQFCIYRIMSGLTAEQCQQLKNCLDILLIKAKQELKKSKDAS